MTEKVMKPVGQSIIAKVGFWQGLVVGGIAIITTLATFFVAAGGSLQRLSQVEKDVIRIETSNTKENERFGQQLQRIEEKMADKDDVKELQKDVKDLIRQQKR